jgi:DNA-directed RNA polymerase subunit alpha
VLIAQRPTLTEENISEFRSRFVIEPLEPGFGYTLGNSLRRTLLSSIPGAAVTSIRIDGVLHEFSTVPGVREDVTEIILNIKNLVVSSEHDEPITAYLRKQGAGQVTAADISAPAGVEMHNPSSSSPRSTTGEVRARADDRARPRLRLGHQNRSEFASRARSRSTRSTRRCSRSPTASRPPVPVSAPTSTASSSTSSRSRPSRPRDAIASAGRTLTELFGLAAS